jgi:hypothetical protein
LSSSDEDATGLVSTPLEVVPINEAKVFAVFEAPADIEGAAASVGPPNSEELLGSEALVAEAEVDGVKVNGFEAAADPKPENPANLDTGAGSYNKDVNSSTFGTRIWTTYIS